MLDYIGTFGLCHFRYSFGQYEAFRLVRRLCGRTGTAIGGGTVRDLLLDVPVFWMRNGIYFLITLLALLLVVLFGKVVVRQKYTWFIF